MVHDRGSNTTSILGMTKATETPITPRTGWNWVLWCNVVIILAILCCFAFYAAAIEA